MRTPAQINALIVALWETLKESTQLSRAGIHDLQKLSNKCAEFKVDKFIVIYCEAINNAMLYSHLVANKYLSTEYMNEITLCIFKSFKACVLYWLSVWGICPLMKVGC